MCGWGLWSPNREFNRSHLINHSSEACFWGTLYFFLNTLFTHDLPHSSFMQFLFCFDKEHVTLMSEIYLYRSLAFKSRIGFFDVSWIC